MSERFILHRAPRRSVLPQRRRREKLPQEVKQQGQTAFRRASSTKFFELLCEAVYGDLGLLGGLGLQLCHPV